jgi:hypothetical protein
MQIKGGIFMKLSQIVTAGSESTVFCKGAQQHQFKAVNQVSNKFFFITTYECRTCGEIVNREYRKGHGDALRWEGAVR